MDVGGGEERDVGGGEEKDVSVKVEHVDCSDVFDTFQVFVWFVVGTIIILHKCWLISYLFWIVL